MISGVHHLLSPLCTVCVGKIIIGIAFWGGFGKLSCRKQCSNIVRVPVAFFGYFVLKVKYAAMRAATAFIGVDAVNVMCRST